MNRDYSEYMNMCPPPSYRGPCATATGITLFQGSYIAFHILSIMFCSDLGGNQIKRIDSLAFQGLKSLNRMYVFNYEYVQYKLILKIFKKLKSGMYFL